MGSSVFVTEFHFPRGLDWQDFQHSFEARFPEGQARHHDLAPDVLPDAELFYLHIPHSRKEELEPFLEEYGRTRNLALGWQQNNVHPFCPVS